MLLYFVVLITRKKKKKKPLQSPKLTKQRTLKTVKKLLYHIRNTSTFPFFLSDLPRTGRGVGRGGKRANEKNISIFDGPETWNDDSHFIQIPIT